MTESTKAKALDALEGMRQIVRREMVITGSYVEDEISNPNLIGAICGGRKHCAIGSLWAGAGIRPTVNEWSVHLPGVGEPREGFLRHRHGLRLAYDSLNAAAQELADRRGLRLEVTWESQAEGLFEGHYDADRLTKRDLLAVIAAAKRRVKAA